MTTPQRPMPPIPHEVERLLIIAPSWVGDCVMATPVFRAVREARPETFITAIVRPGLAELFNGATWFSSVIELDMRGVRVPGSRREPEAVVAR